ncbi:hypothetical protein OSTOST_02497 [Ostertagia ostertagi]
MYKLPPLVPVDLDVKPADVMYFLPSYHNSASSSDSQVMCNGLPEENHDPVEVIERKQHALIKSLMNLTSTLDNLLTEMGKSTKVGTNEKGKSKSMSAVPLSTESVATTKDDAKKDKEAKKEARKAAKAEAKSKVGSAPPGAIKPATMVASDRQWTINADLVLSGKLTKEALIREASQFLSQFDALGSQFNFGIADLIASHLIGVIKVFAMGFHRQPNEEQKGAREFVFWHWAQLQFKNPRVQLVKHIDTVITPFARAYLRDGREVLFDLEGMTREEIESRIATTLGKTELVMKREELMEIAKLNPADFGSKCKRQVREFQELLIMTVELVRG